LKKVASAPLLFLLLLAVASAMRWNMLARASPGILDVPGKYATIQDAINNASSGDLIFVHKGTYYEDVAINKSVSLVGEDRNLTVIYGSAAPQPQYVISLIAGGVTVKDLTVRARTPIQSPIMIGSAGNVLENNVIENGFYGLQLSYSSDNVISNNTISNNQYGVYLFTSGHNEFSDNDIANNVVTGVELHYSSDNVFSGNNVNSNANGLALYSSTANNVFYHNNFNNILQLSSDSINSTNVWSLNGEGNYWSDYTGQDLNSDGIGNIPYNNTDTEGGDSYPLTGPFYDLDVVLNGQTYHVNLVSNSSVSGLKFAFGEETGNRMVIFNVAEEKGTVGFSRIMIPLGLMDSPFIVLGGQGEITPTVLNVSTVTNIYLYFTWVHSNQTISIISSKTMHLYNDLLGEYAKLLADLDNLNVTQSSFLENYSALLVNLKELQDRYLALNASYTGHLSDYSRSVENIQNLLVNLKELQDRYLALNASYTGHLSDYSRSVENIQNLMYVFATTTAIFLITTIYLSKRANMGAREKPRGPENEQ